MFVTAGFTWFHLIPGVGDGSLLAGIGIHQGAHLLFLTSLACALLVGFAVLARRQLNKAMARPGLQRYYAEDKLSFRTAAELYGQFIFGQLKQQVGTTEAKAFFSVFSAFFAYIFVCNAFGLLPGFLPPTENPNTNVGIAIVSYIVFNYAGLSRDFKGYLKHMAGPVIFMAPLIFAVELLSGMMRPFSLYLRLTGNMFGDHTVFAMMSDLVPLGVPAAFLGLALFVSALQAYIFTLLSTVYVSVSLPSDEH